MSLVTLYVSAARLALEEEEAPQRIADLNRLLPRIRQLLSCVVCCRLLCDPYGPRQGYCQHNVCRLCVRGRKLLDPMCPTCKEYQDFKTYDENRQIRCLLLCYKSLCEHVMASSLFSRLSTQKPSPINDKKPSIPLPNLSVQGLILEGASYDDIFTQFNIDLPRPSMPPRLNSQSPMSTAAALPGTAAITRHVLTQSQNIATPAYASPSRLAPKQEQFTPPTESMSPKTTLRIPSSLTITQYRNAVELPAASTAASVAMTPAMGYVGPNRPGIVVPMVSSSATTTAPLSIASAQGRIMSSAASSIAVSNDSSRAPVHFKLTMAPGSSSMASGSSTITTTTMTMQQMQQLRNGSAIKTVSDGSTTYSVLFNGVGNKVKRKTDDEENSQRKSVSTSTSPLSATIVQHPTVATVAKKKSGCRCGQSGTQSSNLTCCGQRCICYTSAKGCVGCRCKGCKNKFGRLGSKVCPVIPQSGGYEIQITDEHATSTASELTMGEIEPKTEICTPPTAVDTTPLHQQSPQQRPHIYGAFTSQHHMELPQLTPAPSASLPRGFSIRSRPPFSTASPHTTHTQNTITGSPRSEQARQAATSMMELRNVQLIQNSEGNYQVFNVFTTSAHNPNANHMSGLQRTHTFTTAGNSSGAFILPPMTPAPNAASTVTTTQSFPHIILQQQHYQRITTAASTGVTSVSLPPNYITVHPIGGHTSIGPAATASPLITSDNTITLSPIVMSNARDNHTFPATNNTSSPQIITVPASVAAPTSTPATAQLTPTMVEVIETNDL